MREKGVRLIHIRSGNENGGESERERAKRNGNPKRERERESKLFTMNTK